MSDDHEKQPPPPKRVKLFWLPRGSLLQLLQGKIEIQGWPDDATFEHCWYAPERDAFGISVRSEQFEEVPAGCVPDDLEPMWGVRFFSLLCPKERFGWSAMTILEGTELLESPEGRIVMRQHLVTEPRL